MKVLLATSHTFLEFVHMASDLRYILRHLPCDFIECYSVEDVQRHLPNTDVVLLDRRNRLTYWRQLGFLQKFNGFVGQLYADLWGSGAAALDEKCHRGVGVDVRFIRWKEALGKFRPSYKLGEDTFWLPHSCDLSCYDIPRDIDVLFWGGDSHHYPFRQFELKALRGLVVDKPLQIDPILRVHTIGVNDHQYKYAKLGKVVPKFSYQLSVAEAASRSPKDVTYGYYGDRLYWLLSRARICPTGPRLGTAVARYFENAACGIVTVSSAFYDMEDLGFEHGKNIWITSAQNFVKDLAHLLEHDDLVQEMSENAKELIRTRHSRSVRARELYEFLCKKTGKV